MGYALNENGDTEKTVTRTNDLNILKYKNVYNLNGALSKTCFMMKAIKLNARISTVVQIYRRIKYEDEFFFVDNLVALPNNKGYYMSAVSIIDSREICIIIDDKSDYSSEIRCTTVRNV